MKMKKYYLATLFRSFAPVLIWNPSKLYEILVCLFEKEAIIAATSKEISALGKMAETEGR